jgi:hypothetical protein
MLSFIDERLKGQNDITEAKQHVWDGKHLIISAVCISVPFVAILIHVPPF